MDAFYLLSSGAKFDKKKFKKEIDIIKKKNIKANESEKLLMENEVPKELDFFGNSTGIVKETAQVDHVESEEEAEEIVPLKNKKEAINFRNTHKIKVYGEDIPYPIKGFEELLQDPKTPKFLKKSIKGLPFKDMTPIQMQSIPIMISGRDLLACAPTGTGKTMAFALPTLYQLAEPSKDGYRAVVISPTRELARQIYTQFLRLTENTKFKIQLLTKATAAAFNQPKESRPKFDVLITTPLRLVQAIKEDKVDLITQLVFDEGDKLFELGFLEQVDEIIAACKSEKLKKALFSATIPAGVEKLATTIMHDSVRVVIGNKDGATEIIQQELVYAGQESGKLIALNRIIKDGIQPPVLIFVQSIDRAKQLYKELAFQKLHLDVIHAERTQNQRDTIIHKFKKGEIWVLICTELMARGLDFKGVNLVINYDFPQTVQSYVHRIGRTGRAGRPGKAITLFTDVDVGALRSVANIMAQAGCEVPEWMLKIKKATRKERMAIKRKPAEREDISTISKYDQKLKDKKRAMIEASKKKKLKQGSKL